MAAKKTVLRSAFHILPLLWAGCAVSGPAPEGEGRGIARLGWLAGDWRLEQGDELLEEEWTTPAGGALLGVGRFVKAGRLCFFEFLRIEERGEQLVYIALPLGRGETPFTSTSIGARKVRFENPEHDDPKVIEYVLEADGSLRTRVEGLRVEEFSLRRVR